jgi:hypothetical protein
MEFLRYFRRFPCTVILLAMLGADGIILAGDAPGGIYFS